MMSAAWGELRLSAVPLWLLVVSALTAAWLNPPVLAAINLSVERVYLAMEPATFLLGVVLGSQLLSPEVRAGAVEMAGSRSPGLAGVGLVRLQLAVAAWLVAAWHLSALLRWSGVALGPGLLFFGVFLPGFVGLVLGAALFAFFGSTAVALGSGAGVWMAMLLLRGLHDPVPWTRYLQLLPVQAGLGLEAAMIARIAWFCIALLIATATLRALQRPYRLLAAD